MLNHIPLAESVEQAREKALLALEEVALVEAKVNGVTREMERLFSRLQSAKSLAFKPGADAEGLVAIQMALITAVKLAFRSDVQLHTCASCGQQDVKRRR
jgi:hypothetical protein